MRYSISLSTQADPDERECFYQILRDFNTDRSGPGNYQRLYLLLKDSEGKVVGGLEGSTSYEWLYVATLAVQESLRHQGFGSKLLAAAEAEAVKRGCRSAYLDTFSFQALPFYEKHGYVIFGTLDDFPPGHKHYYLRKNLPKPGE